MSRVKSFDVYSFFPHYTDPSARVLRPDGGARPGIQTPHCVLLRPTSAAAGAAGAALLTELEEGFPRRGRASFLAVGLPSPSDFGDFDAYEAVLFEPGLISFVAALHRVAGSEDAGDSAGLWAGSVGEISLAFSPSMRAIVRPVNTLTRATSQYVLAGDAVSERPLQLWRE